VEPGNALLSLVKEMGDPAGELADPTLAHFLQRLREVNSPVRSVPLEPADLYFLRPADRTDMLGTLGAYEVHEQQRPARSKSWLIAAEVVALAITVALLASLGLWLYVRQRRQKEQPLDGSTSGNVATTAVALVSVPCASCGKTLKAKAQLAGKKVKCPECGKVVLVPGVH